MQSLDVFGSITTSRFDDLTSDVDFLVRYQDETDLGPWLERHFLLKSRLTGLLGRPVDLIMAIDQRNPFIRQSVQETRQNLYAA